MWLRGNLGKFCDDGDEHPCYITRDSFGSRIIIKCLERFCGRKSFSEFVEELRQF
jgi:hypothetical protein